MEIEENKKNLSSSSHQQTTPSHWDEGPQHLQWFMWKTNTLTMNAPPAALNSLSFYCCACHKVWNISLASLGQLSWLLSPLNLLPTPSLLAFLGGLVLERQP